MPRYDIKVRDILTETETVLATVIESERERAIIKAATQKYTTGFDGNPVYDWSDEDQDWTGPLREYQGYDSEGNLVEIFFAEKANPEEEFPTKGMTPIHRKWLNSKGKLSGRDKKRVSRFVGDRQYHLMETNWGEYKKRKAKETLLSALQDDYSDSAMETGIETESFLVEKEKELETLFSNLHEVNRTKFHSRPWAPWFTEEVWSAEKEKTMNEIREEIHEVYTELSYLK